MRAVFVAVCLAAFCVPASAQPNEPYVPTLNVTATGEANVTPDMAVLGLTVLRQADTAREALDANNTAMSAVLTAMKAFGIEERDLQTSNFSIRPRYERRITSSSERDRKIIGYDVSNALTVRVRDLERLGEVLDRSVSLGVNSGGNLRFTTSNPQAAIEEARKTAVANALAQARTLTDAAGVELGPIRAMSEDSYRRPRAQQMFEARVASADAVPVAAGENTYTVSVSITFAIAGQ